MKTIELENERKLIARCKKGDERAQMKLYKKYCRGMFSVSVRILNDPMKAEDAMQEAFLSAFQKMDSFSGEVPFGAWLKRIVVNKSLDSLRGTRYFSLSGEEERLADEGEIEEFELEDVFKVKEAMMNLPENYRLILSLFFLEGYDHEEISEILGVSYANSRTMLNRAKNKLKTLLN